MVTKKRAYETMILDLDIELEALCENLVAEDPEYFVTQKQLGFLAGLISQGLKDTSREQRLKVLRLLAQDAVFQKGGFFLDTSKKLPGQMASVLIELLKENEGHDLSGYGRELLLLAEERIEARTDQN